MRVRKESLKQEVKRRCIILHPMIHHTIHHLQDPMDRRRPDHRLLISQALLHQGPMDRLHQASMDLLHQAPMDLLHQAPTTHTNRTHIITPDLMA